MTDAKNTIRSIEQTRTQMAATIGELEQRLSPAELHKVVGHELEYVETKVRQVVQEHMGEAKTLIKDELVDARQALRGALDEAESKIKTGLAEARDTVKQDLRIAADGAKHAVRAATLGKVETLATQLGDTMNDTRDTLVDTIRNNPLPAALAGLGMAWLLMNRSKAARSSGSIDRDGWRRPAGGEMQSHGGVEDAAHRAADTVGHFVHDASASAGRAMHDAASATSGALQQASSAAGTAFHGASEAVGRVATQTADAAGAFAHSASDASSQLAQRAGDAASFVADGAKVHARRVEQGFQSTLQESPFALGAAALVAGAVVGLSLPRTQIEDHVLGETRDSVVHRAEGAAHDVAAAVGHLGQNAADAMKQTLGTRTPSSGT